MFMKWTFLAITLVASCLSGCDGSGIFGGKSKPYVPLNLAARPDPPVADIPVPRGFRFVEESSRTADSGVARFIDHMYKGNADKFAVSRFYKTQLSARNWVLLNELFILGQQRLEFQRPGEECRVTLSGGGFWSPLVIKVQLWTSQMIAPAVPKRTLREEER